MEPDFSDLLELDLGNAPAKAPAPIKLPEPTPAPAPVVTVERDTDGNIVHTPTGAAPSFDEQLAAHRTVAKRAAEAEALKKEETRSLEVVADDKVGAVRLVHGDVVAGAVAEGNGILTHWSGSGPLTRGKIADLATVAGLPETWLPKPREPKTQANLAVKGVAAEEKLTVIVEKRGKDWRKADVAYDARWRVIAPSVTGEAGEAAGTISLVVTLDEGALSFTGDETIAAKIEDAFAGLVADEIFQAGHVTAWLSEVLKDRLGGVKYGGCWYVPKETRETAERLINAVSAEWGSDWMNPPTPIATSAQLARGIANGLAAEVDVTLFQLGRDNEACVTGKIGEKAAVTYLRKFKAHAARVAAFEQLLGEALVKESKKKVEDAIEKLDGLLDDGLGTAKRFELIWEEVERDIKKAA